jgi:hypothetical protein
MATKLDKDLVRETTVTCNDREVIITLGENQTISMKLKGMKSGMVSINIIDLYNQLTGGACEKKEEKGPVAIQNDEPKKGTKENPMISLLDLRSKAAYSDLDYEVKTKFDGLLRDLIEVSRTTYKK